MTAVTGLAAQATISCTLTIEEVSDHECRQTLEGDVSIGVIGLGALAERIICHSLKDVYSGIPEIARRCGLAPARREGPRSHPAAPPTAVAAARSRRHAPPGEGGGLCPRREKKRVGSGGKQDSLRRHPL